MSFRKRARYLILHLIVLSVISGCASSFQTLSIEDVAFLERAQTRSQGNLRVTAAVPSAEESKALFGVPLYTKGIQPVWLEIENNENEPLWFLPVSLDSEYFAPLEVSYLYHRAFAGERNAQMDRYFRNVTLQQFIAPKSNRSGFVFTHLNLGSKSFNVDLVGEDKSVRTFTFFISVPGLIVDYENIEFEKLYPANEIASYDDQGFRSALEKMPCCTTNEDGTKQIAPMNIVVVGNGEELLQVLIRSGWNETATAKSASLPLSKTVPNIPDRLKYKPVEPMYFFGRQQDAAFRKARIAGHANNHLRLWLAPMRVDGKDVWIGQIARNIEKGSASNVVFTLDLDEVRYSFLQDVWYSQRLVKFGYVKGLDTVAISNPREAAKGTFYFTDGLRGVLWVSATPISLSDVQWMEWAVPPER